MPAEGRARAIFRKSVTSCSRSLLVRAAEIFRSWRSMKARR